MQVGLIKHKVMPLSHPRSSVVEKNLYKVKSKCQHKPLSYVGQWDLYIRIKFNTNVLQIILWPQKCHQYCFLILASSSTDPQYIQDHYNKFGQIYLNWKGQFQELNNKTPRAIHPLDIQVDPPESYRKTQMNPSQVIYNTKYGISKLNSSLAIL